MYSTQYHVTKLDTTLKPSLLFDMQREVPLPFACVDFTARNSATVVLLLLQAVLLLLLPTLGLRTVLGLTCALLTTAVFRVQQRRCTSTPLFAVA